MSDIPPPPSQAAAPQPAAPLTESDERLYAALGHWGIILFGILPPLIVWLVYKDRSAFVNDQGREALNFSILVAIAMVVGSFLTIILIGILIIVAAWIMSLIFCIQGGLAAKRGDQYRYPFNWRIIK